MFVTTKNKKNFFNIFNATNKIKLKNQKFIMSPDYITGLSQTDGSFFCSVIMSSRHKFGLQFRPKFTLTADLDSAI